MYGGWRRFKQTPKGCVSRERAMVGERRIEMGTMPACGQCESVMPHAGAWCSLPKALLAEMFPAPWHPHQPLRCTSRGGMRNGGPDLGCFTNAGQSWLH